MRQWTLVRPIMLLAVAAIVMVTLSSVHVTSGKNTAEAVGQLELYLDVVNDGDDCDIADSATAVLVGQQHDVQVCVRNYISAITAFDARVEYAGGGVPANQLNTAPEVADAAPAVDDNPDANAGATGVAMGGLGAGTDCTGFGAQFPKAENANTVAATDTIIFCSGAMGDAALAFETTGFLLATIDMTAIDNGVDALTFAAGTNISAFDCGTVDLTCTGAFVQKLDSADLSITKTSNPTVPLAGQPLTYTVTVTNGGPAAAPNPTVIDDLPDDQVLTACVINHPDLPPNYDGFSGTPLCNVLDAPSNQWTIGGGGALNLDPGQSFTVDLTVDIPLEAAGKTHLNVAAVIDFVPNVLPPQVGVPDPDFLQHLIDAAAIFPNPLDALEAAIFSCLNERLANVDLNGDGQICDNATALQQTVAPADLTVTKEADAASVGVGSQVTWTVTVDNDAAASTASAISVTDTVDINQSIVSASGTDWTCAAPVPANPAPGNSVTCTYDLTVAPGASASFDVVADVLDSPANITCENTAVATWADPVEATGTGDVFCLPPDVAMYKDKHPETPERDNVVNLWICEPPYDGVYQNAPPPFGSFGPGSTICNENGEGRLLLAEVLTNIFDPEGLGAFEFQVKFDHKIFDINVTRTDFLYSTGRIPGIGDCNFSIVNENAILFGCVSKEDPNVPGIELGPTGSGTVAILEVTPESDMKFRLHPGQENGVVRRILDENCEAADIFGDPVADGLGNPLPGIVTGGLIADCDDVDVTVRILEGDLNLDCIVDVLDDQAIAWRYGAFFGSLRYDPWYDLEPALKDFDVDIKDLQKVFGRNGSTCSQSGLPEDGTFPAQPPVEALSNGPL
ncbi:MAG: DUF11 domain-containing protein [Dehalococcoidia bacterium]